MASGILACVSMSIVARDVHLIVTRSTPAAGKVDAILDGGLEIEHQARAVLLDGRVAVDNANKFAVDERFIAEKQTPVLVNELHGILGETQTTIASVQPVTRAATGTLDAATARVRGLQPVEDNAAAAVASLNAQLIDPRVGQMLDHVNAASANLEVASQHIEAGSVSAEGALAHGEAVAANLQTTTGRVAHPFACWHLPWHPKPPACMLNPSTLTRRP